MEGERGFRMKNTILKQIMFPVLIILVLLTAAIVGTVVKVFSSSYRAEIGRQNESIAFSIAESVSRYLDGAYSLTDDFWRNSDILSMDGGRQTAVLQAVTERNPYIELAYIVNMEGMQTGRSSGECGDRKNRWWFIQAMQTRQPFVSKSYFSATTNMPCASIIIPMYKDGEMAGLSCSDLKLDYILSLVDKYSDGQSARYSFIIDGDGVVVAHPDHRLMEELYNFKTLTHTVIERNADGSVKRQENNNAVTSEERFEVAPPFSACIQEVLAGRTGAAEAVVDGTASFIAYAPVSVRGSSDSWGVITVQAKSGAYGARNSIILTVIIAGITALVIAIFIMVILANSFTRPIRKIVPVIEELAEGNFTNKITPSKSGNEIDSIILALNDVGHKMNRYITDLTHATAEKERISAELNVATQIQGEMLPQIFPPYENHPELELFATMEPAKEVGGDFYDFYLIDDDHFGIVVGDVSGKGVPAALFMVIAKTLVKDTAMHSHTPAEIFEFVNNILCEGNDSGLFVTCWLGILTLSTGELTFANAGHTAPILYKDGKFSYLVTKPNLMLAGMEGMHYANHSVTIQGGDRLFVYTDGITEATNAQNELFGEERLLQSIEKTRGLSSKEVLAAVRADIDAFVKDAVQFDDITMLELSFKRLRA